jgi:hypothetical protein
MPEVLNADLLTKVVVLLTSTVGLLAALVALKARTIEQAQAAATSRVKLRSYDGIKGKRPLLWLKIFIVVGATASTIMLLTGLFVFVSEPSLATGFSALVFVAFGASYVFAIRRLWGREPVSKICREATLNLQGTHDVVVEECVAALRRCDLKSPRYRRMGQSRPKRASVGKVGVKPSSFEAPKSAKMSFP